MITIEESGMKFGSYTEEDVFCIEKSEVFLKLQHLKTVEFIVLSNNKEIWLVEAKTSSPNPGNHIDFSEYMSEIEQKFDNSLCLFLAILLQRYPNNELSEKLKHINLTNIQFKFIFVVKNHKTEWLMPLKDSLQQKMTPLTVSLNLGPNCLVVLNENIAKHKGIIV